MSNCRFLKRKEIDIQIWNNTITHAANGLPYAFSSYLDLVAENWDALIWGRYEAIMPLVWLRKLGVKCLYQPYYCQQLGVFGNELSKEVHGAFLHYIEKHFYYANINLNPSAHVIAEEFNLKPKKNLLLDLRNEYSEVVKKYSENQRRNIRKAEKSKLTFAEDIGVKDFQKFYLENINPKKELFKNKHEVIFKKLSEALTANKTGKIFSAISEQGNLLASSFIIKHEQRIINIINTSSPIGQSMGASHFLFDAVIRKYAGGEMLLDFEGSSIPGIARFYEGFGAEEQTFYNFHTSLISRQKQRFL